MPSVAKTAKQDVNDYEPEDELVGVDKNTDRNTSKQDSVVDSQPTEHSLFPQHAKENMRVGDCRWDVSGLCRKVHGTSSDSRRSLTIVNWHQRFSRFESEVVQWLAGPSPMT